MTRRVHVDSLHASDAIRLDEDAAHYVRDVLRLEPGATVELFDGLGMAAQAVVEAIDRRGVTARLTAPPAPSTAGESPRAVILASAIPKGERWEWCVEKATEAGCAVILPLHTARGVVQIPAQKAADKVARWSKIAAGAARQSHRSLAPRIAPPCSIADAIGQAAGSLMLVPHTSNTSLSLSDAARAAAPGQPISVWIGPEGGWTDDELSQLTAAGATCVHMGPRIWRAETAAVVACALIQSSTGDLV